MGRRCEGVLYHPAQLPAPQDKERMTRQSKQYIEFQSQYFRPKRTPWWKVALRGAGFLLFVLAITLLLGTVALTITGMLP